MKIETLRWFNNKLEMIDQRILPAAFEYLSYYSAASVAEGIRSMVVRGRRPSAWQRLMAWHWRRCGCLNSLPQTGRRLGWGWTP